MTQGKLKLVKYKNGRTKQYESQSANSKDPVLSPEEVAEAARFKAMTAAKAARQAMLRQIMAEVAALDENMPAA
jgi:hypothetical protein